MISGILVHAARHHADAEVVSRQGDGTLVRHSYAVLEQRARQLARALGRLGVQDSDRVATLAWNGHRHMELYYGVSGMGAIVHTVNPRLAADDIVHILKDAGSTLLFTDPAFASLVAARRPADR